LNYFQAHTLYLTKNSKYPGLDFLRTIALLSVVLFHTVYNEALKTSIFRIGWIGVDLFFVLSGFLVGGILFDMYKHNSYNIKTFYIHRFLRIYPVYVFILFFTIVVNYQQGRINLSLNEIFIQFIMSLSILQSYLDFLLGFNVNGYCSVGGGWSLAIEWQFYLFFPLLFWLILKKFFQRPNILLLILFVLFLSGIFVRLYMTKNVHPDDYNWYFAHVVRLHSRYDELIAGVFVAILLKSKLYPNKIVTAGIGVSILLFCILYLFYYPQYLTNPQTMTFETIWFPTFLGIAFASIVLTVYNINFTSKCINILARLSYSIYLVHLFLPKLPIHIFSFEENIAIRILLILMISYFVHLFIEYPFLRVYKSNNKLQETKT